MRTSIAACFMFLAIVNAMPFSITGLLRRQTDLQAVTDTLLFTDSMDQFQAARNAKDPPQLDWTSDGCSYSPDEPLGFDFLPSCQRHDFGYRNCKAQSRFTDANKAKIDSNLKSDLYNQCAKEDDQAAEGVCKGVADVYYDAVWDFGAKRAVEAELEQFQPA